MVNPLIQMVPLTIFVILETFIFYQACPPSPTPTPITEWPFRFVDPGEKDDNCFWSDTTSPGIIIQFEWKSPTATSCRISLFSGTEIIPAWVISSHRLSKKWIFWILNHCIWISWLLGLKIPFGGSGAYLEHIAPLLSSFLALFFLPTLPFSPHLFTLYIPAGAKVTEHLLGYRRLHFWLPAPEAKRCSRKYDN